MNKEAKDCPLRSGALRPSLTQTHLFAATVYSILTLTAKIPRTLFIVEQVMGLVKAATAVFAIPLHIDGLP